MSGLGECGREEHVFDVAASRPLAGQMDPDNPKNGIWECGREEHVPLLDVAMGASGVTGAVAQVVVRKMGPGKAMSGLEGRVG